MQVEYKKEWMDTYLWIRSEKESEVFYEEKMIQHNPGEGRLEVTRQEQEGNTYFCYKVTGKKALNSIYAVLPIGEHQVRSILGQVFATLEAGKEYLLSEEDFILSPNYIFATLPRMELEFCYLPGYGIPLREQLEGLFEYLLNRVDYEDKQAVNLLYDCYMFCMKEKGGLAEIKKLLAQEGDKQEQGKENEVQSARPVQRMMPPSEPLAVKPEPVRYQEAAEKKIITGGSYVSWLAEKIFPWKRKELPLVAEEQEEYRAEPAGSLAEERTVLLSAGKGAEYPELICDATGEVVYLRKFPFYIGSAGEYADFVPVAEGVSRIHCCISKKEDRYYLSDLNSTNGTYLNGKEVNPGQERLLSANDEIRICSQEFYIKFPCH